MPKVAMGHNFVLLKKGADSKAFSDAAIMADKVRVAFTVPLDQPIRYPVATTSTRTGLYINLMRKAAAIPF